MTKSYIGVGFDETKSKLMSKTKNGKLSEKQLEKSWIGVVNNPLSSNIASYVGTNGLRMLEVKTIPKEDGGERHDKLLVINSTTRESAGKVSFTGDDVTNKEEMIHGSGFWDVDENGIAGPINFTAHSIALGDQSHG